MNTTDQYSRNADRATSADVLAHWVCEARKRTIELVADLDDDQLIGPQLPTINPLLWEIAHAAWFQDYWVVQQAGKRKPVHNAGAELFDSIAIDHDLRWNLPLPSRNATFRYLENVRDAVLELLDQRSLSEQLVYFVKFSVFHEDMHTEAFTYTRQTLAYPAPRLEAARRSPGGVAADPTDGDAQIAGGTLRLGAVENKEFVFDNEQWAHEIEIPSFRIARRAVTQAEFAAFVEDDGYRRPELWCPQGWQWCQQAEARHPVYWSRDGGWLRRHFDQWVPLEPQLPVHHVNWFEADAYCRWADRRLPAEAEWELAAAGGAKRHYPWGETEPTPQHAHLDWQSMGPVEVAAHAAGDSPFGCRQMIGNVWEWTATTFYPYPGFAPGFYREYSLSCFGQCKVLRGGCWATRSRLIRNTWRNYYQADRRDVFAGFRTCAR